MNLSIHRRSRRVLVGCAVVCAAAVPGLVVAQEASAASFVWLDGYVAANDADASSSYPAFRGSGGLSDSGAHKVAVAAHYSGGTALYASYVDGFGSACHSYDGSQTLGALLKNPHTVSQNPMVGTLSEDGSPAC